MKIKFSLYFLTFSVALLLMVHACKKDDPIPDNPYDAINRDTTRLDIPIDSLTITYVHTKILAGKCALPGCHDGNFEPDFRTPQTSFSNMVYAPITKNNAQNSFKYRVIPFDTTYSVLYERITNCCFVNNNDRMPQDNIGVPLPDADIQLVAKWIMGGARDIFGQVRNLPNAEPVVEYFVAFDTISLIPPFALPSVYYTENRLDNVAYNPFIVPINKSVFYVVVKVTDDSTAESQLKVNKLKISTKSDDFTSAKQYNATYLNAGGQSGWLCTIPTATLSTTDTLYIRYYVNDGSRPQDTEFPRDESIFAIKTYASFVRQ
jgi:hypothetical protein